MIVPMRMKSGDCVIASIASALQRPYEDIAATLGIALDASGIPAAASWPWPPDQDPLVTLADMCRRLRSLGAFLVAELPSAFIEMIVIGSQSPAVLIVNSDDPEDCGRAHALACRDGRVFDCRSGDEVEGVPLAALVFLPESAEVQSADRVPAGRAMSSGTPQMQRGDGMGPLQLQPS
jgi:hypothetical protein